MADDIVCGDLEEAEYLEMQHEKIMEIVREMVAERNSDDGESISSSEVDALLRTVRKAYERVIYRTAQLRPDCQILVHGYDRPFVRNKGAELFWGQLTVAGPWMYPVMAGEKSIGDAETRDTIAGELVDRFNAVLAELASEHERFHYVDLRGTLPSVGQWDDEIHPKSAGFRRMARTFAAAMDRALR